MRKTALVLAALLAVAGICVMLWPVFTGHRLQSSATTAVQEFLADRDEPEQQYLELLADLQAYNQRIYAEKQRNLTNLEACEVPAADLTAYGIEDEIIGVLEMPTRYPPCRDKFCSDGSMSERLLHRAVPYPRSWYAGEAHQSPSDTSQQR